MSWIRKIQNKGGLKMVSVPAEITHTLNWCFGDNLMFYLLENGLVCVEKVVGSQESIVKI